MEVVIETPKGSDKKFKFDANKNGFEIHKSMPNDMTFPFAFGFVPGTLGEDGDPLDVIVLSDMPLDTGTRIEATVVGCLRAKQTVKGKTYRNDRFVAINGQSFEGKSVKELTDLGDATIQAMQSFFHRYLNAEDKSILFEEPLDAGESRRLLLQDKGAHS